MIPDVVMFTHSLYVSTSKSNAHERELAKLLFVKHSPSKPSDTIRQPDHPNYNACMILLQIIIHYYLEPSLSIIHHDPTIHYIYCRIFEASENFSPINIVNSGSILKYMEAISSKCGGFQEIESLKNGSYSPTEDGN